MLILTCFLSSLLAARVDICFPYQYKFYLAYDKVRYYFINFIIIIIHFVVDSIKKIYTTISQKTKGR